MLSTMEDVAPTDAAAASNAAVPMADDQAPTELPAAIAQAAAAASSHPLSHAQLHSPQPVIQYSPFPASPMHTQDGPAAASAAGSSSADSNRAAPPAFSPMQLSSEPPALTYAATPQQQQHAQYASPPTPLGALVPASPVFASPAAGSGTGAGSPPQQSSRNNTDNGGSRRASKRAEDKAKSISTVRFNPAFAPPFSVETLKAQAAAAAASVPPPPPAPAAALPTETQCQLCPKRFMEFRFLHKHLHVMHGQPLDPAICPPAPAGATFASQLSAAVQACLPQLEAPQQLFILRARLPANIRKNLAARKVRLEKRAQRGDEPAAAASAVPRKSAGGSGGAAAARGAGAARGVKRKKKKKTLFGEYEGSTDEEESSYSSAEDRELDRVYDEQTRAYLEPARLKKIERAKQRAAAKAAQAASLESMTPEQRQQQELANFGVDSDDFSDLELSSDDDAAPAADDDDAANLLPEDDFDTDPDSKRSEIERMKLHASMELADRRAYDSTVQHEMNETYGFADSNPRTMVLSRDSVLVKLDLMDVLNNGILQYFSESQLDTLKSLLPACDQTAPGLSGTFISPFFIQSMFEYQELLMTGSLDPDMREMRNVVSSRRRREQTDVWKDRNYERYWGEHLSSKGSKKDGTRAPPNVYWKPAAFKKEYQERQKMEGLLNRVVYGDIFAIRRRKQLLKAEGRWPLPSITELQAQRDSGLAAAIYVPRVIDGVVGVAPKTSRDDSKRKKYVRKGAQLPADAGVSDEAITDAITASVKKKAAAAAAAKPHNIWEDGDDSKSNAANDDDSSSGGDHRGGAFEGEYDDGEGGDGMGAAAAAGPVHPPSARRDRRMAAAWEDEFENPGEFDRKRSFPFAGPEDPDDDEEDEFELPVSKKAAARAKAATTTPGSAPKKRPTPSKKAAVVKTEPEAPLDPNAPPPDPNAPPPPPPAPKPKKVRPPKDPNAPPRVKKEKAPVDPNAPPKEKKPRVDPRVCQNPDDPVEVARAAQVRAWVAAGLTTTGKVRQVKKKPKLEESAGAGGAGTTEGATPAVANVVALGDVQMAAAAAASAMPIDSSGVAVGSVVNPVSSNAAAAGGAVNAIPMQSYGYAGYPAHYYSQMQWAAAAGAPAAAAAAAAAAATPATAVSQQPNLWQQQQQQMMLVYQHQQAEQARQYKMIQDSMLASTAAAAGGGGAGAAAAAADGSVMTPAVAAQLAYLQGMLSTEPGFLTQMQNFFNLQQQGGAKK